MAVAGDLLVACLENGPLTLFDVANGQRLRNFRPHPGVATCVEFSPDSRTIASGGSDRTVRLWEIESGECTRSFQGHGAFVSAVIWHPTEPWLVSAGADGTVRVWNLDQGRCAHVFEGHRGPVRALALSDDGTLVFSAGQDGTVALWDLEERRNIRFLRGHRGAVIAVAQVGRTVAAGGEDGTVRLWELDTCQALRVIRLPNPIQDLVTDADGTGLLVAHGTTVSRLSLPEPLETKLPLVLAETAASAELAGRESEFRTHLDLARSKIEAGEMEAAIAPLRAAREVRGYELHEEVVALWNTVLAFFPKAAPRSILELRRIGTGRRAIGATALMPDGNTCVAGAADGSLQIFDAVSGSQKGTFGGHDHGVTSVDISEDGEWLASSGRDGAVRVWNASTAEIRAEFLGHEGAVQAVAFTPDGKAVVSAGDDGSVRLWPLNDVDLPVQFGREEDAVSALAVSSDGRFVVSGGWNNSVTVWSLARRAELRRMNGHEGAVNAIAISPDCRVIASAGEDATVRLWDLEGGRSRRVLSGHEGAVQALGFTPDARFLLSAGNDATLRIWDVRTGKAAHVVEGHAGKVFDIDLDRDGGLALSAGSDSRLRLWFLDWEPELPERGSWDDRVRPFLDVFLRRCEANVRAPGQPGWNESGFDALLDDLGRRGFGWLAPDRVRRELKSLAHNRDEDRAEERERTHELVKRRQRQKSVAPAKKVVAALTRNLGLKLAGAALLLIVGILGVMSLRTPQSEEAEINRTLFGDVGLLVRERGLRLQRGAVLSYQQEVVLETPECRAEDIESQTRLVLDVEQSSILPLDPGTPAEDDDFRESYAQAVFCVGDLGGDGVVRPILSRGERALHPYRLEDLLSILIRVGGASDPAVVEALTDHAETVRHLAALTLVHGGSSNGAGILRDALRGDEMRGVEAASFVLTELISTGAIEEAQSFETVRRLCRSIDPRVRRNAVRSLVLFESTGPARQLLDEALEDSDVEVSLAAERTLTMIRTMKIQQIFGSN
jgi:WD40 repeat protein